MPMSGTIRSTTQTHMANAVTTRMEILFQVFVARMLRRRPHVLRGVMMHEALHLRRGFGMSMDGYRFGYNDAAHYMLDYQAQFFIHSSGLGFPSANRIDRWGSYLDQRYSVVGSLDAR